MQADIGLEHKFAHSGSGLKIEGGFGIEGYASVFDVCDHSGDVVQRGAYASSLAAMVSEGRQAKMLWQHDPAQPIGVWEDLREDGHGLYVKGRLLQTVSRGREAAALIEAGAIDGLSIGFRARKATKNDKGQRLLTELELWEVSLVTFPMQARARVGVKGDTQADPDLRELTAILTDARQELMRG